MWFVHWPKIFFHSVNRHWVLLHKLHMYSFNLTKHTKNSIKKYFWSIRKILSVNVRFGQLYCHLIGVETLPNLNQSNYPNWLELQTPKSCQSTEPYFSAKKILSFLSLISKRTLSLNFLKVFRRLTTVTSYSKSTSYHYKSFISNRIDFWRRDCFNVVWIKVSGNCTGTVYVCLRQAWN